MLDLLIYCVLIRTILIYAMHVSCHVLKCGRDCKMRKDLDNSVGHKLIFDASIDARDDI